VVRAEGIEPTRPCGLRIFIPLRLSPPRKCGFVVWTISTTSARGLGGKELAVWRSGNRYALPISPHPLLRLSTYKVSRDTLTMNLVQKIGETNLSNETDFILAWETGASVAISMRSIRAPQGPAQRLSLVGILQAAGSAVTHTALRFSPSLRAAAEPL
jgi:hypothetical protein